MSNWNNWDVNETNTQRHRVLTTDHLLEINKLQKACQQRTLQKKVQIQKT